MSETTTTINRERLRDEINSRPLANVWSIVVVGLGLVVIDIGLHYWFSSECPIVDGNDAAILGKAIIAIDLVTAAGLLAIGVLGLIMERRRRHTMAMLKKMREQERKLTERNAQQERLGLLGTLAGGLAHELGQPLSVARVGIEGIYYLRQLGRSPSPEHLERTLSRVGMSLLAMTQTIDHLRSLTVPVSSEIQAIDLGSCVAAVINDRDQWLRLGGVDITLVPHATPVLVLGDAMGIRLVLVNLLRNAVESVIGQSAERRLVMVTVGPGPIVTVRDSGPGIAEQRLKSLFDPFQSSKTGIGRGVGLSLAAASAKRMGADLEVVSHVGSGTTFTLRMIPAPTVSPIPQEKPHE